MASGSLEIKSYPKPCFSRIFLITLCRSEIGLSGTPIPRRVSEGLPSFKILYVGSVPASTSDNSERKALASSVSPAPNASE